MCIIRDAPAPASALPADKRLAYWQHVLTTVAAGYHELVHTADRRGCQRQLCKDVFTITAAINDLLYKQVFIT